MKKIIVVAVFICALLALGIAAYAEEAEDAIAAGTNKAEEYSAKKDAIGLTGEQTKKLKEIKENTGKKNAELVKQRIAIRNEIREMMAAEDADLTKVEAKVKELEKVNTQLMLNKLSGAKEANKVLTKEQKQKMTAKKAEKMQTKSKMEEKGQKGGSTKGKMR